jgi:hypothetical protein
VRPIGALCLACVEIEPRIGFDSALSKALGLYTPLVFVDVRGAPGAYRIAGTYTASDGTISVRFKLRHGEEATDWVEVKGAADDPAALAQKIVAEARKRIE